jgi:hypothetical protein
MRYGQPKRRAPAGGSTTGKRTGAPEGPCAFQPQLAAGWAGAHPARRFYLNSDMIFATAASKTPVVASSSVPKLAA